jgi:hypothetical protein
MGKKKLRAGKGAIADKTSINHTSPHHNTTVLASSICDGLICFLCTRLHGELLYETLQLDKNATTSRPSHNDFFGMSIQDLMYPPLNAEATEIDQKIPKNSKKG